MLDVVPCVQAMEAGSALDLGIQPLQLVGDVDLQPIFLEEVQVLHHLLLGTVQQLGQLEYRASELIGHDAPLFVRGLGYQLCEGRGDGSADQEIVALIWTISSAGNITGSSNTGCVYDCALGDRTDNLKVSENCAGTVKPLSGVGTVDPIGIMILFSYTADDGSAAGVFRLTKQ